MIGKLDIDFAWVDPERAAGQELAATWATLKLQVSHETEPARCLTEIVDKRTASVRDHAFVPLYPLAEWIVTNWWHILYEPERERIGRADFRFQQRHNILHAGDGYFFPSVLFLAGGDGDQGVTEIVSGERETPLRRYLPVKPGFLAVETEQLQQVLRDLVDAVVYRLEDFGITGTYLQIEWAEILRADSDTNEFRRSVASAGLDPNDIEQDTADEFVRIANSIPRSEWDTLFNNVGPDLDTLNAAAHALVEHRKRLDATEYTIPVAADLRGGFQRWKAPQPWLSGYQLAREVRATLGAEETLFPSIERVQQAFGFTEDVSDEAIRHSAELPVDAIVGVNRGGSPGMTIRSRTRDSNKVLFLLCRSMGEYLIDGMNSQQIISGSRSARQKRNRAFAAEFLAPAALLRRRVHGYSVSPEEVEELGLEFGVSGMVIAHQLENHRIAAVNTL